MSKIDIQFFTSKSDSGVAKGGAWAAEHPQRKSERPQRIANKLVFRCIRFD